MSHILESPEEVLSTLQRDGKRRWLYPKVARGRVYKFRKVLGYFLITLYVVLPFLRINGRPVLLLDIVSREFVIFGQSFFATDTLLLLLVMLSIALLIIGLTAVLGRVWCGWACPQTVYLEFVFRPIEALLEGSPAKRAKRDSAGFSLDLLWRKLLKYFLYAVIAAILANAFLAYFIGSETLLQWMRQSPAEHPAPFFIMLFVTGLVLFDFSYFREQMCTIACPYARLQSVLLDQHSVIVGYDEARGEPRGKGRLREFLGDCVDCHQCVEVCPTGIDIRRGLQLECIHCAQCVDACDSVMEKVGKPLGLIRYSSLAEFRGAPLRILRPRTAIYCVLLVFLISTFTYRLVSREDSKVLILRETGAPFSVLADGAISNHVRIKVSNLSASEKHYSLEIIAPTDVRSMLPESSFSLEPKEQKVVNVFFTFPARSTLPGVLVRIVGDDGFVSNQEVALHGP